MNTIVIKQEFQDIYNRAFNAIRNRIVITHANLGENLKVRVIGNGTMITRENGLQVMLFNTNAMQGAALKDAVAMLKPEAFNAAATDLEAATLYLRQAQNLGSIPFTVPVNNRQLQLIGQGATIDATVAEVTIKSGDRAGEVTLALNFNRVIPAVNGTSAASAFDALLADTNVVASGASSSEAPDPFANTTVGAPLTAAQKKAAAKAAALAAATV